MTEKQIADIVEKLQTHFVVFYTKAKQIQLQDHKHRIKHQFDTWQQVSEFAKTLPQR